MWTQEPHESGNSSSAAALWPEWSRTPAFRWVTVIISFAVCFGLGGIVAVVFRAGIVVAAAALFVGSLSGAVLALTLYIEHVRLRKRGAGT